MPQNIIQLVNINKVYDTASGSLEALHDITINIEKGEIYGIIGFSGAGKSTLLRCINLLEKISSGQVIINGENLLNLSKKELRKRRQKIGMIFQHFNLVGNSTVFENIALPMEIAKVDKEERKRRVRESLEIVELSDKDKDYPAMLSGGQKQRVAIARAVAMQPDILLCDEPTSALDPQTTDSIISYLKKINKQKNITIVLVTHQMQTARKLCDHIGVMEKGRLVETINMREKNLNPQSDIGQYLFYGDGDGI